VAQNHFEDGRVREPTPKFIGKVNRGRLELESRESFSRYLSGLEGVLVDVVVKRHRKSISTPQIRYYYGVIVTMLGKYLGMDKDNMDHELKRKFLGEMNEAGMVVVPSKTVLDTGHAEDFFEEIRQWALMDLMFTIPLPNEVEIESLT
jgi:hypothetical protein